MEDDPLIARRDLARRGIGDSEIRAAVTSSSIIPVRRGFYVSRQCAAESSIERRHVLTARATVRAGNDALVLSHQSAALVWGVDLWNAHPSRVHVTVGRTAGGRIERLRHLHAAPLDPQDICEVDGLRVTSPERTVVDLACALEFEAAVCAGDSAMRILDLRTGDLMETLGRCGRRRGGARARRVIEFLDGRSASVGESRSRVYMDRFAVEAPDLQVALYDDSGGFLGVPDFLWRKKRVLGEFDGLAKYTAYAHTPGEVVVQEKIREDRLRANGWRVERWTWADLCTERTAQALHRALGTA